MAGGAERVTSVLANSLSDNNDVHIILVSSLSNKSFYSLNDKIVLHCLCEKYTKKPSIIKKLKLLRKQIKVLNPDVIIAFLPHIIIYTFFAIKGLKIPLIVSERGDPFLKEKNKSLSIISNYIYKKADACVFQTTDSMQYYLNKNKKHKIYKIIPNPTDITYCYDYKSSIYSNTILSVGSFKQEKNYPLLFEAFAKFNKLYKNEYLLKIYGGGPLKEEYVETIKKLDIEKSVEFCGLDNDWIANNKNCSFYVLSSSHEGMPNSLLEALAAGFPCISSDCPIGGPKDLIDNGRNGLLFKVNDCDSLVSKMCLLADSDEIRKDISKANLNFSNKYSVKRIKTEWQNLINSVTSKNR